VKGCLAPFIFIFRQFRAILILIVVIVGLCMAASFAVPNFFNQLLQAARQAGYSVYTFVSQITGNPSLKLVTYEVVISAKVSVERDMGILALLYGERAEVTSEVRVALGADLQTRQTGVLSCEINTDTLRIEGRRALFAGAAFDPQQIRQAAFRFFKEEAARQALARHWTDARARLEEQFISRVLGFEVPEQPTLTTCPADFSPAPTATPSP